MSETKQNIITIQELISYLNSLEEELETEKLDRANEYRLSCNINMAKVKKREVEKIQKVVDKEYEELFDSRDEIMDLLEECKDLPSNIEKLKILRYMLYRVDIIKAENIVGKLEKKLMKKYEDLKQDIGDIIYDFPAFEDIDEIDFSAFEVTGENFAKTKEQYKLEYTEEEKKELIEKELEMVIQAKEFNSMPIPHEILKSLDKDVQPKIQKFNNIRQKRLRILSTMQSDYEELIEPREILGIIEDAFTSLENTKDILSSSEYNSIKRILSRRKRRVMRSTNEIRNIIKTKENKTGISNFNIEDARYGRMEALRKIILDSTNLINSNSTEGLEQKLEKLKISYEREKQYASVIEKLNSGESENYTEAKAYEQQIIGLESRIMNAKKIVSEEQEKIKNAKRELLTLWKMEIVQAVSKRKEKVKFLPSANNRQFEETNSAFDKLKKISRWKTRICIKYKEN